MRKIAVILAIMLAGGQLFAQQTELDSLKHEYAKLKKERDSLMMEIVKMEFKEKVDSIMTTIIIAPTELSEENAMLFIKDHYEFYNRNFVYRDVKLRRQGDRVFWVSVEEKLKEGYSWIAKVKTLTVEEDFETYTFR